jgi:hypothetical protein
MYNPGNNNYYYLGSASANAANNVMAVSGKNSLVGCPWYNNEDYSICPLVSLKSSVTLTLASN